MPRLFFDPSARLQKFLGRELIADPNLAIVEFVKNAYDAGATSVLIQFTLDGRPREQQIITISDDGTGMDLESFKLNWMRPGFSQKAADFGPVGPGNRTPIGEKGLGRLAAGRLGDVMEVYTRRRVRDPWLHVAINWQDFEDMNRLLRSVPISYELIPIAPDEAFPTGTLVRISSLTLNWAGMIPGRKLAGRSDVRLGRLREDLAILVLPFEPDQQDFQIQLSTDSNRLNRYHGPIVPHEPRFFDYRYEFSVTDEASEIVIRRVVTRSESVARHVNLPRVTRRTRRVPKGTEGADEGEPLSFLRCGPFSGTFLYSPLSARRLREMNLPTGVFLYRDGVRVEPYGNPDDDWLEARARKAIRQGHAGIQPNNLSGYVRISKIDNSALVDMSNRQGLVENEAYEDFIARARGEFRRFERWILEEFVEPAWEPPQRKAQLAADRAQRYSSAMIRALVHSIRQPVAGLRIELRQLRRLIQASDIPQDRKTPLLDVSHRADEHVRDIARTVDDVFEFEPEGRPEKLAMKEVAAASVERVRPFAQSRHITLRLGDFPRASIYAPRALLVEALASIVRNAVEVDRGDSEEPWVEVSGISTDKVLGFAISDNGVGMTNKTAVDLFKRATSTKGRPGVGLLSVRELLALYGGTIEVVRTSSEGTTLAVSFPSGRLLAKETM
jgi:signal transduction histidine kinase/anti-sigma regulatory factor (Ser/Thr protein kinase)